MNLDASSEELDEAFARIMLQTRADSLAQELASLKRRVRRDSVHDTRVQSRRLRTALEAFKDLLPPHPRRSLYGAVRQITTMLGKVREREAMLSTLGQLASTGDMAENLCREYLEERFRKELQNQKRKLKRKLRGVSVRQLHSQTNFLVSGLCSMETLNHPLADRDGTPGPLIKRRENAIQPTLFRLQENPTERAQRLIGELANPVLSFRARYDFRRATDLQLHELRIAAKKLRYALEIFDSAWPLGLEKESVLARTLQDAGGYYHDWSVLRDAIQSEIRRLTKQDTTHLAFQLGRLLAQVEDRKADLRKNILPALTQLQAALRSMLRNYERSLSGDQSPWRQPAEG